MAIHVHITEFAGRPVVDYPSRDIEQDWLERARGRARVEGRPVPETLPTNPALEAAFADPSSAAWRLRVRSWDPEEDFEPYFARFLSEVDTRSVPAVIIGSWGNLVRDAPAERCRDLIVDHSSAFPALRALFFGEILPEEYKLSWIRQTDVSDFLYAFPRLTEFVVRGGVELEWNLGRHRALRRLTFQTSGLPVEVVVNVYDTELPELRHLDLWLGAPLFGGCADVSTLAPLLSGSLFPRLRSVGLRNFGRTDELVAALADAPLTGRLEVLDLSHGTLTDEGGRLLLETPVFRQLKRLDLHDHYLSEDMTERVREEFTASGTEVDVSERDEPYDDERRYYPAVIE